MGEKKKDITVLGTRETVILPCVSASQLSSNRQKSLSLPAQAFVSCQNLALSLEREITSPFLKVNYCWLNPR